MKRNKKRIHLIKARKEKGWKQKDLAEKVKVTKAYICMIESGKRNPTLGLAIDIAKAVNKEVNEVF